MKSIIAAIVESNDTFGRFLNTLSLLEYIGARKIFKSQPQHTMDLSLLTHAVEESRHAMVLKKAALKHAPECTTFEPQFLLCPEEAVRYMQQVDHASTTVFGESNPLTCYYYTTYLVEQRATSFYTDIDQVLVEQGRVPIFRGILVEEERHLDEITQNLMNIPDYEAKLERLGVIEALAFEEFKSSLNKIALLTTN